MPVINVDDMEMLMRDVMEWTIKCKEMEACMNGSVGEVANAYALIHKDYKWKLSQNIGKLWFYVCGSEDMNPFEKRVETKAE